MIEQLLKNINGKKKANLKSVEIAKLSFAGVYTDSQTGIKVEIKDGKINAIEGGIELYARAWRGVNQLGFGKNGTVEWERFRIFNPPIMIDDPNGTVIRTWEDQVTRETKTRKLREDPIEAIRQTLAHTIKVSSKSGTNIVKGSVGNTVSTFYPDAGDPGTTSKNGWLYFAGPDNSTWATFHDATDSGAVYVGAATPAWIFQTGGISGFYSMGRGIFLFDTHLIGSGQQISSAILTFTGANNKSNAPNFNPAPDVDIYTTNPASNVASSVADYGTFLTTSQTGAAVTYANSNTTGTTDFVFNAIGIGNIAMTGISKFGTRNANYDVANSAPSGTAGVTARWDVYYADQAGTASDPKLVVTHSASSAIKTINGLAKASVKTVNGLAIASVKTWNGLA